MKKLLFLIFFILLANFVPKAFAQSNSFVSIVNPVRGNDFWDLKDQRPETAVLGQASILDKFKLPATWLIRFDALDSKEITGVIENRTVDEKGLFLEVTPSWAQDAKVQYRQSTSWHAAGSAFLTGYERKEREKLIDAAFEKFKSIFEYFPSSVGAWWIDSYSLGYMQEKYGITGALIVADQYSTDNYQIWGQYFGTPYYPVKNNALHPAGSTENKLPVVMMQWALRDPVNSYGNGVDESTFSVQANDYMDYHNLDINYFSRLIDIYTNQKFNQFSQVVVGLENSYQWNKYGDEYGKQIEVLSKKKSLNQISVVTMKNFANWYKKNFPEISPEQIIITDDPLGSFKKAVWYMNPYYRAALFVNEDGVVFRDIRQYIEGEEELCFRVRCDSVNFATFATRVLDDVTYGTKWVIDEGKIKDFSVLKEPDGYLINYKNEAGNKRQIEFLPRDIQVDDKIFTIDGAILNVINQDKTAQQKNTGFNNGLFRWSISSIFFKLTIFSLFIIIACLIPGLVLTNKLCEKNTHFLQRFFLSTVTGFVLLTVIFYVTSLVNLRFLSLVYIIASFLLLLNQNTSQRSFGDEWFDKNFPEGILRSLLRSSSFLRLKIWTALKFNLNKIDKLAAVTILIIVSGTIFQVVPSFRSGLTFSYGLGFWGPNTHDGIWHMSLVSQLAESVPPENPIYSGIILKNYHFFYDLMVASTHYLTNIPIVDLIFRFYPVTLSLLLGIGSYYLVIKLFKSRIASLFSLYFVYFAGSFGWIVEFLRGRQLGGESAFWANQAVSFNLNPPFAVSLIIIIALLHILFDLSKSLKDRNIFLSVILAGSLIGFKSYGAILVLAGVLLVGLIRKQLSYLVVFIGALLISILIFLPNFDLNSNLLIFAPFWFIHSMVDSPDRVGWVRITLARETGFANNWFKFISAEVLSLTIFITGNLGLRIISLFSLIKIKSIVKDEKLLFLFIFAFLSFLIPILFIQSGNPWNTIQFSYYGLYTTAVISGTVIARLISRGPRLFSPLLLSGIIILTPINSITTATYYLGRPHAIVSNKEVEALEFLSKQPSGVVLIYPYDSKIKQRLSEPWSLFVYDSTAYVAAISGKNVFVEDEPQNQILLTDYKKRLIFSKDFFQNAASQKTKFLQDNKIKYIYLPKIYNVYLNEKTVSVKSIFENEEVKIYQRT